MHGTALQDAAIAADSDELTILGLRINGEPSYVQATEACCEIEVGVRNPHPTLTTEELHRILRAAKAEALRCLARRGQVLRRDQLPGTLSVVREILAEAGRACSPREIVTLAGGRLPTSSVRPQNVVARDLARDLRRRGARSQFVRTEYGRYTLRVLHEAMP